MEAKVSRTAGPSAAETAESRELECIRLLVEEGDVESARSLVKELEQRWPDSDEVSYWSRVLAPAKVTVRPGVRGRPLEREHAWLYEHAGNHPGCWIAVFGDELVAADPDLEAVLRAVRRTPGAQNALLHFESVPSE